MGNCFGRTSEPETPVDREKQLEAKFSVLGGRIPESERVTQVQINQAFPAVQYANIDKQALQATTDEPLKGKPDVSYPEEVVSCQKALLNKRGHCPVCKEKFKSPSEMVRQLPCGHVFEVDCIDGSLIYRSRGCPVCRRLYFQNEPEPAAASGASVKTAPEGAAETS